MSEFEKGSLAYLFAVQGSTLAAAIYFAVSVSLKTKSYAKTVLYGWLWIFIWAVANCMVIPGLFALGGYDAFSLAPDMEGIVALAFFGWIHGLILAGSIFVIRLAMRGVHQLRDGRK